jgi:hypothetical protein
MGSESSMASSYEAPRLSELGSIRDLTSANTTGGFLDHDFPDGTPFGELTFS